ncbi:hypothetical protein B0A52_03788 [Exophiala mesophila]|uniref:Uncharacterized protein n=1 Tax=Exophiala mesophila TaxID=212818 RepID=A0A438N778_EXOME|nr:hypothetical protein B0A52_03788 [Exophiala mesophila]
MHLGWQEIAEGKLIAEDTMKNTKTFNQQLRKNGLQMVREEFDPVFGPIYTLDTLKTGTTNMDVAARLQYAGETSKWSPAHRKAAMKAREYVEHAQQSSSRSSSESV